MLSCSLYDCGMISWVESTLNTKKQWDQQHQCNIARQRIPSLQSRAGQQTCPWPTQPPCPQWQVESVETGGQLETLRTKLEEASVCDIPLYASIYLHQYILVHTS